jgi:hypothetical protein
MSGRLDRGWPGILRHLRGRVVVVAALHGHWRHWLEQRQALTDRSGQHTPEKRVYPVSRYTKRGSCCDRLKGRDWVAHRTLGWRSGVGLRGPYVRNVEGVLAQCGRDDGG